MTRDELRLELLRLTYTHGRSAAEAVDRAKEMEAFVVEASPVPELSEKKQSSVEVKPDIPVEVKSEIVFKKKIGKP